MPQEVEQINMKTFMNTSRQYAHRIGRQVFSGSVSFCQSVYNVRYGHTMSNTPHPIRTAKLSDIGPT